MRNHQRNWALATNWNLLILITLHLDGVCKLWLFYLRIYILKFTKVKGLENQSLSQKLYGKLWNNICLSDVIPGSEKIQYIESGLDG